MAGQVTVPAAFNGVLSSVTPATGSLLVIGVGGAAGAIQAAAIFSVSASGLTLAPIAGAEAWQAAVSKGNYSWFSAPVITGATFSVTGSSGASTCYGMIYQMFEVTGQAASPIGAVAAKATTVSGGAYNIVLGATPAAGSLVLAGLYADTDAGTGNITEGAGWTPLGTEDSPPTFFGTSQSQDRTGSVSTSVDWAAVNGPGSPTVFSVAAAAIEIKAAAVGARVPDFMPFFNG
jgi:hypothetical protein